MPSSASFSGHPSFPRPAGSPLPFWKRTLDLMCGIAALPVLALAAVAMKLLHALISPGPLLYRQERIGYNGRIFTLYKFRTMRVGADAAVHRAYLADLIRGDRPMQKLDAASDGRLIPGARLLRATGLDELPQLINVLRGEMSLVGPRPCLAYEFEQYSLAQRARVASVPGLTGLWQVSGKNHTTFEEMVRLDIAYGRSRSLWLDLKIIALTLPALWDQVTDSHRRIHHHTATAVATDAGTRAPTFQT